MGRSLFYFLLLFSCCLFSSSSLIAEALVAQDQKEAETQDLNLGQPPSLSPEKPDLQQTTVSYEAAFVKTIVVLVLLLLLVTLTIWLFKKISHGRMRSFNFHKVIKIIERRPLSPKSMLYLIEVSGKQVLLSESQLEVRKITMVDSSVMEQDL